MKQHLLLLGLISGWLMGGIPRGAADLAIPGADGSDGEFNPSTNVVVDLSLASRGRWDASNAGNPGNGVYDGDKWAVVFKYTSVNIPAGVTVSFKNHESRAPVVWLVSQDVRIDGNLILDGQHGNLWAQPTSPTAGDSGPGGFRGGRDGYRVTPGSAGFGPGGGMRTREGNVGQNSAGSYATRGVANPSSSTYGNSRVLPLIGGSGGGGYAGIGDGLFIGGGGGGAILIAASGQVVVNGLVRANGGVGGHNLFNAGASSGGSGGAIRIVCDSLGGTGRLEAVGHSNNGAPGGDGRIRLEANGVSGTLFTVPETSFFNPTPVTLWPPDSAPSARIVSVGGGAVRPEPLAAFGLPAGADVNLQGVNPMEIVLETRNMPTTASVSARIVPLSGSAIFLPLAFASGDQAAALWTNSISLPEGYTAIQARAVLP